MTSFAVLYSVIGACSALIWCVVRRGALAEGLWLLLAWPLMAPILWQHSAEPVGPKPSPSSDAENLERRIGRVTNRLETMEALRQEPEFDRERVQARYEEHLTCGDEIAARAAAVQLERIDELTSLTTRLRRELSGVEELLAQLELQRRFASVTQGESTAARELVAELLVRLNGLHDQMPSLPEDDTLRQSPAVTTGRRNT